eukprot:TRINITY_DN27559_c0_g1_i1.p1 TRINITY_DN27559_c0_g1~~TRINITY_DN27559_c0_g1_i1.p1  ORF type:complete len:139 (-),score=46.89 TRINITY_DN27559_c0_g1_i1:417-833(-)
MSAIESHHDCAPNSSPTAAARAQEKESLLENGGLRKRTGNNSLPVLLKTKYQSLKERMQRPGANDEPEKEKKNAAGKVEDAASSKGKSSSPAGTAAVATNATAPSTAPSSDQKAAQDDMDAMMRAFEKCMVEPKLYGM